MARVLVPLAQGFEEIEAMTVIDVMRRGGVETVTASIDGGGLDVLAAHGVVMRADARFLGAPVMPSLNALVMRELCFLATRW